MSPSRTFGPTSSLHARAESGSATRRRSRRRCWSASSRRAATRRPRLRSVLWLRDHHRRGPVAGAPVGRHRHQPYRCRRHEASDGSAGLDPDVKGLPVTESDLKGPWPFEFQNWVIQRVHGSHSPRKSGTWASTGSRSSSAPDPGQAVRARRPQRGRQLRDGSRARAGSTRATSSRSASRAARTRRPLAPRARASPMSHLGHRGRPRPRRRTDRERRSASTSCPISPEKPPDLMQPLRRPAKQAVADRPFAGPPRSDAQSHRRRNSSRAPGVDGQRSSRCRWAGRPRSWSRPPRKSSPRREPPDRFTLYVCRSCGAWDLSPEEIMHNSKRCEGRSDLRTHRPRDCRGGRAGGDAQAQMMRPCRVVPTRPSDAARLPWCEPDQLIIDLVTPGEGRRRVERTASLPGVPSAGDAVLRVTNTLALRVSTVSWMVRREAVMIFLKRADSNPAERHRPRRRT